MPRALRMLKSGCCKAMYIAKQIQHCLEATYHYLQYDDDEKPLQLRHRTALVSIWTPGKGDHVIEVGCGQGETTALLAAAVGASGRVLAVDKGSAEYGRPITLGQAHAYIISSTIGDRIEFLLSTDLLDPQADFLEHTFDLVVFSHSSWYMSSPQELHRLFARVRPWAKRLGYAEWDARPRHLRQLPHLFAALLQVHAHSIAPQTSTANVRSLILPDQVRLLAENAGWTIMEERIIDTSTPLGYGKSWEIHKALDMAEKLIASDEVSEDDRNLLAAEKQLLRRLSRETRNLSLSTYVFLAE